MEEFSIEQAYDEMVGQDSNPEAAPQIDTNTSPQVDTGDKPTESAEMPPAQSGEDLFDWAQVPQELLPLAKGFQGTFTRKAQELAEQRKTLDQQAQAYAGFAALQRLAQEDPSQAAALLSQYAAQLAGAQGVQAGQDAETDPYAEVDPVTDVERLVLSKVQALEQQAKQWEAFRHQQEYQQRLAAAEAQMNAEYAQIEAQVGRQLTEAEKDAVAQHAADKRIHSLTAAYRDLHWDAELQRAAQKARDEASAVVQQKIAMPGAPSALVGRAPTTPEAPANDRELIGMLYEQMVAAS